MNFCISKLLKSRDEEQLECLCKLIFTIGKTYEEEYDAKYQRAVAESKSSGKQLQIQLTKLDVYLDEMRKLSRSEDLSSRIRFMLMDVLELKQNRWVPRREEEKPKTIDEICGELEKERLEKELSLQEDMIKQPQMGYPSQRRDGGRGDETKKSRSAVDEGGWQLSQGTKGSLIGLDQSSYHPPPKMMISFSAIQKSMGPVPTERQKAVQATRSFTRSRSQQVSRESSLSRQGAATPTTEQVPFQAKSELKGKPDLTEDEIQRKTDNIINEFLYNGDLQEAVDCVKEQMYDKSIVQFIENGLNNVIEREPVARADFGKLLRELLTKQLISREGFIKGFRTILEGAFDIIVDKPKLVENLAQILVPALEQDAQCLHAVKDMEHLVSEEITTRGRLAAAVLTELVKSKVSSFVSQLCLIPNL
ncbi:eukaryotic translation initiation factor 4 gamma 1-like isoform X1 [Artemia franciscana]|uniref:eukaryotic translation initiation factor 4 gamma 1-like isoform X1 n=2 Tax=Artemia franciscana TaxID=6661 RepID=UPI0032DBDC50